MITFNFNYLNNKVYNLKSIQYTQDCPWCEKKTVEEILYVPTGKFLKILVLGYNHLAADALWLKAIGYFGTHSISDHIYTWLYHILDIITTLDPEFTHPYTFGGIILPLEGDDVENGNKLLLKGMKNHPDSWKFPYYLAFNYWYYLDNPKIATDYMARAVRCPRHPPHLERLLAILYNKSGEKETALSLLRHFYNSTDDPELKRIIEERMKKMIEGFYDPKK
ncbi:MAG: hypothetical protein V1872_12880 [bacterium]